jgi:hypothetical protein
MGLEQNEIGKFRPAAEQSGSRRHLERVESPEPAVIFAKMDGANFVWSRYKKIESGG